MAAPKFNSAKPHGVVFPTFMGASFVQDGWHYTLDGEVVRALCTPEQLAVLDNLDEPATTAFVAEAHAAKAHARRSRKHLQPSQEDDGSDVDLVAWLEGRQICKDAHVIAKARDWWGDEIETIEQVKQHAVFTEKLIPEENLKV